MVARSKSQEKENYVNRFGFDSRFALTFKINMGKFIILTQENGDVCIRKKHILYYRKYRAYNEFESSVIYLKNKDYIPVKESTEEITAKIKGL